MDPHTVRELSIFQAFVKATHLQLAPGSTHKKEPPQPDIFCEIEKLGFWAFELVEVVDRHNVAKPMGDQQALKRDLDQAFLQLPSQEKEHLRAILGNALVHIEFDSSANIRERRRAIPDIFRVFTRLRPTDVGHLEHVDRPILSVSIHRGPISGPQFDVDAGGAFNPEPEDALREKCCKIYQTPAGGVDLLAYFETQPPPTTGQLSRLSYDMARFIRTSCFQACWFFDVRENKLLSVVSR